MRHLRGSFPALRVFIHPANRLIVSVLLATGVTSFSSGAQGGSEPPLTALAPFAPEADYDPAIPTLQSLLGFVPGSHLASPEEIERCLESIADVTPRVRIEKSGRTHEGRMLEYAIVSSPENLARLGEIEGDLLRVAGGHADPPAGLPVVIWIGASIHGDEASGADAALALIYHFAADRSERSRHVMENAILLIDPMQNPDGRAHFLTSVQQWNGNVPCLDPQSIQHRPAWPTPRGNHYQMDLNRDWFVLSQPETRAIAGTILRWRPQVTIDLHEMGSSDTYLMSPPRFPINPNVPARTREWWKRFSVAQAQAFGERGWSCYTGDWNEEFSPNRGASWTLHTGAVAILEEQAGTDGTAFERPDGSILSYREAVHHHFVATQAVVETAAMARGDILRDYAANRTEARSARRDGAIRAYVIPEDGRPEPARRLAQTLQAQGIEVRRALEPFKISGATNYWGESRGDREFAAGSYIVDLEQPEGRLARAILEFDPPLGSEFLTEERRRLEGNEPSLLYDASAWCLGMAYGVDVYAVNNVLRAALRTEPGGIADTLHGDVLNPGGTFGFLVDAATDREPETLAALFSAGIPVWASDAPFAATGHDFGVGSLLVKRVDCRADLVDVLGQVSSRTGARIVGVDGALSEQGPDLGSRRFHQLQPPRAAILAGPPFFESTFGAIWYLFDVELGMPISFLRMSAVSPDTDLDRYNILIIPDAAPGKGAALLSAITPEGVLALMDWVRRGGTLIALGEGNWILFGGTPPLTSLRAQQQVLEELPQYLAAARQEIAMRSVVIDEDSLRDGMWGIAAPGGPSAPGIVTTSARDEWLRRFSPPGTILRADLNSGHWLCSGVGDRIPVMVKTDLALRSRQPVETVGRFAEASALRLSGLLWPEARERWALSSYLTREKIGNGQVISFLGNPYYRATFLGTGRLLQNAILLGPGMGTKPRGGGE
jgi:hypothetical protein